MKIDKILIVNVNWLGDVVFSTPFIRAIRENFPESHIACMVVPRCKEILELNPNIDELIIYDEKGEHKSIAGKLKLAQLLKRQEFKIAFLLHRSFTRTLVCKLAGIPKRIGFFYWKRFMLITKNINHPQGEVHRAEYFLRLARGYGLRTDSEGCDFFVSDNEKIWADGFLKGAGIILQDPVVILHPAGNWMPKRWPKENFARLADRLIDEFGVKILITGSAKDEELAGQIANLMLHKPIICCGKTSLGQFGALAEKSNLVISNDSGPLHIAVAVKKSGIIGLYGPTSPKITGPYPLSMRGKDIVVVERHLNCKIPCYDMTCNKYKCMEAISVEEVLKQATPFLKKP